MSENDDLEKRKQDVWSMKEVRSKGSDTADRENTTDKPDPTDISGTEEESDTENMPDNGQKASGEIVRSMSKDAEEKDLAVRDLHNVNVYLYEDIYREMVATFKELDSEYFAIHGEELSKNKEFFNAVFRAGIQSPQLREELDLDEE